jgi:hypothetical protein
MSPSRVRGQHQHRATERFSVVTISAVFVEECEVALYTGGDIGFQQQGCCRTYGVLWTTSEMVYGGFYGCSHTLFTQV